jgi:hypothetical protein
VGGDQGPDHGEGHRQDRYGEGVLLHEDLAHRAPVEEGEAQTPGGEAQAQQAGEKGQPGGDVEARPTP